MLVEIWIGLRRRMRTNVAPSVHFVPCNFLWYLSQQVVSHWKTGLFPGRSGISFLCHHIQTSCVANPVTWVYVYEVSTKILNISAPFISSPFSYIFNKSMLSGTFPTRLKYAIVKLLLKKGDKENVANYRPISLLTSFSQLFERIIDDRLLKHIETNNILVVEQFGFTTSSSTEKASYKLIDNILNALNNRLIVGGIFCDVQKAFSCINHNILVQN